MGLYRPQDGQVLLQLLEIGMEKETEVSLTFSCSLVTWIQFWRNRISKFVRDWIIAFRFAATVSRTFSLPKFC